MDEISADLQIQFASHAADAPFDLVVENTDQEGDVPVHVDYISDLIIFMQSYNIATKNMNDIRFEPLKKMLQPGRKRIKLYCPLADLPHIRIFVDNGEKKYSHIEVMQQWTKTSGSNVGVFGFTFGSVPMPHFVAEYTSTVVTAKVNIAVPIARLSAPITEAINWTGEVRKRLKYPYDQPSVEILQQTVFRDKNGAAIPPPVYDQQKGELFTADEATGALVVRYSPSFSVFEVVYDTGEPVASPALWEEMQRAWTFGNIKTAAVPPVRLVAMSDKKATTASFERMFWPQGFPRVQHSNSANADWKDINLAAYNLKARPGERIPAQTVAAAQGMAPPVPPSDDAFNLNEVPGTRQTATTRVYSPSDNTQYIDVKKIIYFEAKDQDGQLFKLRMLNE
ncbi:MAG: hypothetical protein H7836_12770 [Magnetococcus sp. YQC-3]